MKNLFFLAVLKLDVKDFFAYNKKTERMGKIFPRIDLLYIVYKRIIHKLIINIV